MSIGLLACNENLPIREDIDHLVKAYIQSFYETTSHSRHAGGIRLYVTIVNKTDETLDDIAQLTGAIEITWLVPNDMRPRGDITRTIRVNSDDIFHAKKFDRLSKRLTLDADDSLIVSVVWNLKSNDSTYLLPYFPWGIDTGCYVHMNPYPGPIPRRITLPQPFLVKAHIKIFDRLAMIYVQPVSIKHCVMVGHQGEAVSSGYPKCTDFIQFDPCSVIQ